MRCVRLLLTLVVLSGCDMSFGNQHKNFSLFETSKGTVYLLNTATGETKIIYSKDSAPRLIPNTVYDSEDGKSYEYLGAGTLKALSVREAADRIIEKYKK